MRSHHIAKRFLAAVLALLLLGGSLSGQLLSFARSFEEVEKTTILKPGPSPMDAEPQVIRLVKGDAASTMQNDAISLDGAWEMAAWSDVQYNLFGNWPNSFSTTIPNSVPRSLFQAGRLEDPYIGLHAYDAAETVKQAWCLRKTFHYEGKKQAVELAFDGIADLCDIYLNGEKVASHQGMFGGPVVDVTRLVRSGENTLLVVLKPALDFNQTVVFNCTYGWHYAFIPPLGIWNTVSVRDVADVTIDSPFVATADREEGTVDLSVALLAQENASIYGKLTGTVRPKNFTGEAYSFTIPVSAGRGEDATVRLQFDVPDFRLWWPNGLGEQNLYTMELAYETDRGVICTAKTSFGIRSLEMAPFPSGEASTMYNRTAIINGNPIFLKGAGWCTIDTLMDFTKEKYDLILSRAKEQGLNFLRAWGGGMPETDAFYDLCDEYGICVYQEWPCCWDSQASQPAEVLYETVRVNTKRIRNHPSLILYGGGNEGNGAITDPVLNEMGKLTYEYDGTRVFWRQDGGVGGSGMVHDHIHWSGGSPEQYITNYWNMENANLHEYGMDSMMNLESIAKYATQEEMAQWPIDPKGTIAQHTATFNGALGWTPTPYGYDIDTLIHYASDFLEVNSLQDLVLGSQLAQSMADYLAIQNARIQFPNQSAILYYKLNDVYPGASWSTVDYYGSPKISHYFVQDACRPLMAAGLFRQYNTYDKAQADLTLPIYLLDDNRELDGKNWLVTVKAYGSRFQVVRETSYSGNGSAGTNVCLGDFYLSEEECRHSPLFVVIDLVLEGQDPIRSYTFLNYNQTQGCLFTLPRTTLEYRIAEGVCTITNTGKVPAVGVHFDVPSISDRFVCGDNYFWLEPGESRSLSVSQTQGIDGIDCFNLADTSDTLAPGAPAKLKAEAVSYDSVRLTWKASQDDKGILGYLIYVDGQPWGYSGGDKTEYVCQGLREQTEYTFQVAALDYNENESGLSSRVRAKTQADRTSPRTLSVKLEGENQIVVRYSKSMEESSASNPLCYTLNYDGEVESVRLEEEGRKAILTTSGLDWASGKRYTLTVVGAKDATLSGNGVIRQKFVLEQDLAGYWSFDEGTGTVFYDYSGTHAGVGRVKGWAWSEGIKGTSLAFTEAGGCISAGQTAFLPSDHHSIALWLKPGTEQSGFQVLLAKGSKSTGHFELYASGGWLKLYGPDFGDLDLGISLANYAKEWHHLALLFSKRKVTVYWDGQVASQITARVNIAENENNLLCFGSLVDSQFPFQGNVDEIRLYNRCLTESEVQMLAGGQIALEDMTFQEHYRNMNLEETFSLAITFWPETGTQEVLWSTSDDSVAAVDKNGTVTALTYGNAVITARTADGSQVERCFITVGDFPKEGLHPLLVTTICCLAALLVLTAGALLYVRVRKNKTAR